MAKTLKDVYLEKVADFDKTAEDLYNEEILKIASDILEKNDLELNEENLTEAVLAVEEEVDSYLANEEEYSLQKQAEAYELGQIQYQGFIDAMENEEAETEFAKEASEILLEDGAEAYDEFLEKTAHELCSEVFEEYTDEHVEATMEELDKIAEKMNIKKMMESLKTSGVKIKDAVAGMATKSSNKAKEFAGKTKYKAKGAYNSAKANPKAAAAIGAGALGATGAGVYIAKRDKNK